MPRTGRPSKFTKENRAKAEKLSRRGFTDAEVSEILGINHSTLTRWKQKHKDFCITLKDWKESSDENVKRSLYERACGYSHVETKAQWVTDTEIIDGKPFTVGRWETIDLIKHYPPETTADIFWLKNRQPEKWRDKKDFEGKMELAVIYDNIRELDAES